MAHILRYYVPNSFENYNHLFIADQQAACIDPFDWALAQEKAKQAGVQISEIWLTHGHGDHVKGVPSQFQGNIRGHYLLAATLSLSHTIARDTTFQFAGHRIEVLATPGHTFDHLCFYSPDIPALIAGDTLFNAGVGNTRSGDTEQLFNSIQRLKSLPPETQLYNGHDYMANNLSFFEHMLGATERSQHWLAQCAQTSVDQRPITTLGDEAEINIFLQCDQPHVRQKLNLSANTSSFQVFQHVREARNHW